MSKLTSSNVVITLNGDDVTLKPTPRAALAISSHFGGYRQAIEKLATMDLAAATTVVAQGAGIKGEAAKGLSEKVYRAGLSNLTPDLIEYVAILANGGRRPDEAASSGDDEDDDEGNGEA